MKQKSQERGLEGYGEIKLVSYTSQATEFAFCSKMLLLLLLGLVLVSVLVLGLVTLEKVPQRAPLLTFAT